MKNILLLICSVAWVVFALVSVGTFLNYLFGLSIGFKGSKLPADLVSAVAFLVVAAIFGGAWLLMGRKKAE